jgi:hypothetical protein
MALYLNLILRSIGILINLVVEVNTKDAFHGFGSWEVPLSLTLALGLVLPLVDEITCFSSWSDYPLSGFEIASGLELATSVQEAASKFGYTYCYDVGTNIIYFCKESI